MGFITRYGSFWGTIPQTSGRVLWVAPSASYTVEGRTYSASDQNDGLSPERALLTLAAAVALTTANVGDVIVMLPGAHSYSSAVTIATAGIVVTGIPSTNSTYRGRLPAGGRRRQATLTTTATAAVGTAAIIVTAADVEIAFLTFLPGAAGGQGLALQDGSTRAYVHDCSFALVGTAAVTTYGVHFPLATALNLADVTISSCYFQSGTPTTSGANGAGVAVLGTTYGLTIENSTFELKGTAAWATAILSSGTATTGFTIRDVDFIDPSSPTTFITTCINTTGSVLDGSAMALRCYFPLGSDALSSTATADLIAAESYLASSAGGVLATNA